MAVVLDINGFAMNQPPFSNGTAIPESFDLNDGALHCSNSSQSVVLVDGEANVRK